MFSSHRQSSVRTEFARVLRAPRGQI